MFDSIVRLISWTQKDANRSLEIVLSIPEGEWEQKLQEKGVDNYVVLSTCNRFEIYYSSQEELHDYFAEETSRKYVGLDAINHLYRVTAGLESMSVGENEILHQVKESFDRSVQSGRVKGNLALIFRRAISSGKLVRRETRISRGKVSIPALSMDILRREFGVKGKKVAVIGTGKMATDLLKYVQKMEPGKITVIGRTRDKAISLADTFDTFWNTLSDLKAELSENDIVMAATSSKEVIVSRESIMAAEGSKVFLDISNPRNIDEPKEGDGYRLIDLNSLMPVLERNKSSKQEEIVLAERMVNEQVRSISERLTGLESEEVIRSLYKHAEEVKQHEISRFHKALAAGTDFEKALEAMTSALVKKLLASQAELLRKFHGDKLTGDIRSAMEKAYLGDEPKISSKKPLDHQGSQSQQDQTPQLSRKP